MSAEHTWVILAGGKGTRSENPDLPKCLQEVRPGTTVLQLTLSCIQEVQAEVILVLGHGSEMVIAEAKRLQRLFTRLQISWMIDSGMGPVSALIEAREQVKTDFLGIILGDTVIQAPLNPYFARFKFEKSRCCAIVARQSRHLFDSDKITLGIDGELTSFAAKGAEPPRGLGSIWGISGVSFLRTSHLYRLEQTSKDVAGAIFSAFSLEEILAIRTAEYFRDSGTPERLDQIRSDLEVELNLGLPSEGPGHPAIFVDRDGTLFADVPKGRRELVPAELFSDSIDFIANAKCNGYKLFLITNQPGVAKGQIELADVYRVHNALQEMLLERRAEFDDFEFCPHHPESGFQGEVPALKTPCECRKPLTGMVAALQARHRLDMSRSMVLGDSERDRILAKNLEIEFLNVRTLIEERR